MGGTLKWTGTGCVDKKTNVRQRPGMADASACNFADIRANVRAMTIRLDFAAGTTSVEFVFVVQTLPLSCLWSSAWVKEGRDLRRARI